VQKKIDNLKKEMSNLKTTFELEVRGKVSMLKKENDAFHHERSIENQFVEYNPSVDKLRGALYALNLESLVDMNVSSIGHDIVQNLICAKPSLNFHTQNIENSWISATLNSRSIIPTHYMIRGRFETNDYHLKSWVLEGKTLNGDWLILHSVENQIHPFQQMISFSLKCEHKLCEFRLKNTGLNTKNDHHFCLSAFDIFGKVFH
jgi:hypothetical protein